MRIQKRRCDRGSGKSELPKQKTRVFERAKHKTTRCIPYKSENTVSSTIITFLDKTNLRKQTSVHLFMRSNYANCRRKNVPQKLILINSPNDEFKVCVSTTIFPSICKILFVKRETIRTSIKHTLTFETRFETIFSKQALVIQARKKGARELFLSFVIRLN